MNKGEPSTRDLILSVGTHRNRRPLSPLEVANAIAALANEMGWGQALERISLGESTARRFLRLREMDGSIAEQVGWGREPGAISFAVASEISRLSKESQQRELADAARLYALTKDEARQVVQTVLRAGRTVESAVDEVTNLRPQVQIIHAVLGAVTSEGARDRLAAMTQGQRDDLFEQVRLSLPALNSASGRLTPHTFSVIFDREQPTKLVEAIEPDVNSRLLELLSEKV